MKKLFTQLIVFFIIGTAVFADESNIFSQAENNEVSSVTDISFFDKNFLVHSPGFMNLNNYQNPAGEIFSYKEVKSMLGQVEENSNLLKSHSAWRGTTLALVGLCIAGIATDVVFTCVDGIPHAETAINIASITSILSFSAGLVTGGISTSNYLKAVDNYNYAIITAR